MYPPLSSSSAARGFARRGFTLTELAIVLSVVGLMLAAIWVAADAVTGNHRVQRMSSDLMAISSNFRAAYNTQKPINVADGTDMTSYAINGKFLPDDMLLVGSTTQATGPWSNSIVTIQGYQTKNAVAVKITNLSKVVCNNLANATLLNSNGLAFATINATTRNFAPFGSDVAFTSTAINNACNLATASNVLTFGYTMF